MLLAEKTKGKITKLPNFATTIWCTANEAIFEHAFITGSDRLLVYGLPKYINSDTIGVRRSSDPEDTVANVESSIKLIKKSRPSTIHDALIGKSVRCTVNPKSTNDPSIIGGIVVLHTDEYIALREVNTFMNIKEGQALGAGAVSSHTENVVRITEKPVFKVLPGKLETGKGTEEQNKLVSIIHKPTAISFDVDEMESEAMGGRTIAKVRLIGRFNEPLQLIYSTTGIEYALSYEMHLPKKFPGEGKLIRSIVVRNNSGVDIQNATLKIVAGGIVRRRHKYSGMMLESTAVPSASMAQPMQEEEQVTFSKDKSIKDREIIATAEYLSLKDGETFVFPKRTKEGYGTKCMITKKYYVNVHRMYQSQGKASNYYVCKNYDASIGKINSEYPIRIMAFDEIGKLPMGTYNSMYDVTKGSPVPIDAEEAEGVVWELVDTQEHRGPTMVRKLTIFKLSNILKESVNIDIRVLPTNVKYNLIEASINGIVQTLTDIYGYKCVELELKVNTAVTVKVVHEYSV